MILTLSFVYTFASWLKRSQRERNLLWAFWNTYLWVDNFFGPTLRMLAKEATYFDVLHAIYTETSGRTLEKKCYHMRNLTYSLQWNAMKKVRKLVRLEYMQIFPAGRLRVLYDFFGRSVLCDPRTLINLYHSMFSCPPSCSGRMCL